MQEEIIHTYPPLTSFSHGAGCGCKLPPHLLEELLQRVPGKPGNTVIADQSSRDDCAVIRLQGNLMLLTTADFFLPVVNDPKRFGAIAAANALSDVWAMGGTPVSAIAILGWPVDQLPVTMAGDILAAAQESCNEAGIAIHGGHTIDLKQPVFGLSVTGIVQEGHLRHNHTAHPGDILFLTRPIGTGVLLTAIKRGVRTEEDLSSTLDAIAGLNQRGARYASLPYVHAMTDLTGFGILGHVGEMLGKRLNLHLDLAAIPIWPDVQDLIRAMCVPDAAYRNWNYMKERYQGPVDLLNMFTLSDPQTNGGLMVAVDPAYADSFEAREIASGFPCYRIGRFDSGQGNIIAH